MDLICALAEKFMQKNDIKMYLIIFVAKDIRFLEFVLDKEYKPFHIVYTSFLLRFVLALLSFILAEFFTRVNIPIKKSLPTSSPAHKYPFGRELPFLVHFVQWIDCRYFDPTILLSHCH